MPRTHHLQSTPARCRQSLLAEGEEAEKADEAEEAEEAEEAG
jgi:hypothetical protein